MQLIDSRGEVSWAKVLQLLDFGERSVEP